MLYSSIVVDFTIGERFLDFSTPFSIKTIGIYPFFWMFSLPKGPSVGAMHVGGTYRAYRG